MLVVGSRLRGNETRNNAMRLPRLLAQADAEPTQAGRNYPVDLFVAGDARLMLEGLLAQLPAMLATDAGFLDAIAPAKAAGEAALRRTLGLTPPSSIRCPPACWPAPTIGCATSPSPTPPSATAM